LVTLHYTPSTLVSSVESDMRAQCGHMMSPLLEKNTRREPMMVACRIHSQGEVLAVETCPISDRVKPVSTQFANH